MTPRRWQRVRAILEEAIDLPRDARAAFLDKACGGDSELRVEVESVLAQGDQMPPEFLEPPRL